MGEPGAWRTEEFDNGRDFQNHRQPPVMQTPPIGTPPAGMYNPPQMPMHKDAGFFGILAMALRIAEIVFTLIGFSVMGANKVVHTFIVSIYYTDYYVTNTVKFTAVAAFTGLLSVDVIVCFYAILQLVHSIYLAVTGGAAISSPTSYASMITYFLDQVLAYALMGACAAGAGASYLLNKYNYCSGDSSKFCNLGIASVSMSFIAFACLAISAVLYPIRLLRLSK